MGSGAPQANSVLWISDGHISYRDKRWRVGKLVMSTFQIRPQNFSFCIWMTRNFGGSDVTGRHGKGCYSNKQRVVSSQWLLVIQRRAMARWKVTDEYIANLTSNIFLCKWIIRMSGGVTSSAMWVVHLHQERTFCDIENFVARTDTSDGALESYWWVHSKIWP